MMEEMGRGNRESDIMLPDQFPLRTIATPEKRLLLAVLEEAVGTFQRHLGTTERHSRATFADVEVWFASEDATWLYSFVGICDALEIDATYVRSGLRRWLGRRQTSSPDKGQPTYRFPFRRISGRRHRVIGQRQSRSRRA
jgi:hypothetical protein